MNDSTIEALIAGMVDGLGQLSVNTSRSADALDTVAGMLSGLSEPVNDDRPLGKFDVYSADVARSETPIPPMVQSTQPVINLKSAQADEPEGVSQVQPQDSTTNEKDAPPPVGVTNITNNYYETTNSSENANSSSNITDSRSYSSRDGDNNISSVNSKYDSSALNTLDYRTTSGNSTNVSSRGGDIIDLRSVAENRTTTENNTTNMSDNSSSSNVSSSSQNMANSSSMVVPEVKLSVSVDGNEQSPVFAIALNGSESRLVSAPATTGGIKPKSKIDEMKSSSVPESVNPPRDEFVPRSEIEKFHSESSRSDVTSSRELVREVAFQAASGARVESDAEVVQAIAALTKAMTEGMEKLITYNRALAREKNPMLN
jgi:hypothetical protein